MTASPSSVAFAPPAAPPARPAATSRPTGRLARPPLLRRLLRGRPDQPAWARPGLLGLLLSTAVLYLWDLGASGWANAFYSAAAQAGSTSWEAFFFGSSDAGNSITVDKPPAALWVLDLSVRAFGLSSWSLLVPEALMGIAAVWLLHCTVARVAGPGMGLLAGGILATTPVAALMFRFDNPDAIVVLLLVAATYGVTRALEAGRTRWLVLAAGCVGTAFLAKMLQAYLVLPAFTGVWLLAAPLSIGRRVRALLWAGLALLLASGWWILAVVLTPAADRPYIGGSTDNSIVNLLLGYNGFGRLTGNEAGSVGGGGGTGGGWGVTGLTRLFTSEFGAQASWLLPAALVLLAGGLWARRRAPRTDALRAALLLWGGSLLVTAATFSFGAGIIHPYYTVALAPELGGTVALGAWALWLRRGTTSARLVLAGSLAVTADWGYVLLGRIAWHPGLRGVVLVGGLVAAGGFVLLPMLGRGWRLAAVTVGICAGLLGPSAYSVATAATPHSGAIPSAGPSAGGAGGFGAGAGAGAGGGQRPAGTGMTGTGNAGGAPGGGGGIGGILGASTVSAATATALEAGAAGYTWVVATVSSNSAAGYQLATGAAVMPIGGFNGTDASPTLAQFQADVGAHRVHYFLAAGGGGGGATTSTTTTAASQITAWVQAHYATVSLGGTTFYDLTSPLAS